MAFAILREKRYLAGNYYFESNIVGKSFIGSTPTGFLLDSPVRSSPGGAEKHGCLFESSPPELPRRVVAE